MSAVCFVCHAKHDRANLVGRRRRRVGIVVVVVVVVIVVEE